MAAFLRRYTYLFSKSICVFAGALLLTGAGVAVPEIDISAKAEGVRSGVILGNRGFITSGDIQRSDRRRAIDARNARIARDRLARRGVLVEPNISAFNRNRLRIVTNRSLTSTTTPGVTKITNNNRKYHKRINSGDLQRRDRRRSIDARNERIARENAIRRSGVASNGAGVIVVGSNRQGILTSDFNGGVAGTVLTQRTPCPRSHNCGYRIYSDGTGPRIITPGIAAGGDLPQFDGLSGPQIITLD